MTHVEYELVRRERPDLRLLPYQLLWRADQRRIKRLRPSQLIARRTEKLLTRTGNKRDRYRSARWIWHGETKF